MKNSTWLPTYLLLLACMLCACTQQQHFSVSRADFPVKGVDLSAHNGNVDFAKLAADSVEFAILKVTEGTEFCDAMFARNFDAAKQAGLLVGAYHFFRFDAPGHIQAYHFLSAVADKQVDLPLAIDVEEWQNAEGIPESDIITEIQTMATIIEAAGYRVMFYSNKSGYEKYLQPTLSAYPMWLCSLSGEPEQPGWALWQHSHQGSANGVRGHVDLNTFNGSRAQFQAWLAADPQ